MEFSETIDFSGDDKKSRFTETQIVSILKEVDAGLRADFDLITVSLSFFGVQC